MVVKGVELKGVWPIRKAEKIRERLDPQLPDGFSLAFIDVTCHNDSYKKVLIRLHCPHDNNAEACEICNQEKTWRMLNDEISPTSGSRGSPVSFQALIDALTGPGSKRTTNYLKLSQAGPKTPHN